MNKRDFLDQLAQALDYEGEILPDQDVASIDVWDSLGVLSIMQLLSDLGVNVQPEKIAEVHNVSELLAMVKSVLKD